MAYMTNEFLSGGTGNGRPIKVVATASAGTTIHTMSSVKGRLYLYACNTDTAARVLTIEFGGITSPDDTKIVSIPPQAGDFLVVAGLPLAATLIVRAFASVANVITISGYEERFNA